ncbi:hypothetical protein BGZ63DRAFT_464803 [Mariannaea sp. PMI_226]|nr:hypothetical protein BGZ63DRAFT_464803 [Mariannaea sp. PMI_226]
MDGLREQGRVLFQDNFAAPTATYDIIKISQYQGHTKWDHQIVPAYDLLPCFNQPIPPSEQPLTASLYLVKIDQIHNGQLQIAQQQFLDLMDACHLDGYLQYMIKYETYGLQHFKSDLIPETKGSRDVFYINTVSGMLLWSYDSSSVTTKAICMPRSSNRFSRNTDIFRDFLHTLDLQKHLINHSWLLQFVYALELARWLDCIHAHQLSIVRGTERQVEGFWIAASLKSLNLQQLTRSSQSVALSISTLSYAVRHVHTALELLDIPQLHSTDGMATVYINTSSSQPKVELARQATRLLNKQVNTRKLDLEYLRELSNGHISIISSVISQIETETSIRIAASSMEDSSSMKVLALMTMFFLPATFFATLFAVPSLHWTEHQVISGRFWIYWAFTLPCTFLLVLFYKGWSFIVSAWKIVLSWFPSSETEQPARMTIDRGDVETII